MGLEYDYYGNYSKIQNEGNLFKSTKDYKLKLTAIICLFVPCVIILGINTYLLYVTQVDYKYLLEDYDNLLKVTRNMKDDIQRELKPRLDFVTHFLSYKLPNAVLHSFKKSNQELTSQLSGITFNLDQLLELYKSILGFDDNWELTPDTQHMTCSFVPPDQVSSVYERAFAARERYAVKMKHPPSLSPLHDRTEYETGRLSSQGIYELIKAANLTQGGNNETEKKFQGFIKTLLSYMGINENSTGLYKRIHDLTEIDQKLITSDNSPGLNGTGSEAGPTPTPSRRHLTPTFQADHQTTTEKGKSRKRRYAANFGYAINRSDVMKEFLKGVKVKIHTITGTVSDMCIATRNILGLNNNSCASTNKIFELIKCLAQ